MVGMVLEITQITHLQDIHLKHLIFFGLAYSSISELTSGHPYTPVCLLCIHVSEGNKEILCLYIHTLCNGTIKLVIFAFPILIHIHNNGKKKC